LLNVTSTTTATQSIQIVLGGAPVAELAWVSSYEDLGPDDLELHSQDGVTAGTTPVTIVSAPDPDSNAFQLKSFMAKNQNSAAVTLIVQFNDNATLRELLRVTLSQHDTLIYEQASGWRVLNSIGAVKIAFTITDTTILAQVNPSATTLTDGLTVPAGFFIDDGHVIVANRSTATSFRLSLAPNGIADDVSQYFAYDLPIRDNDVYDSALFNADALDVVRVYATLATLTFSIFAKKKVA